MLEEEIVRWRESTFLQEQRKLIAVVDGSLHRCIEEYDLEKLEEATQMTLKQIRNRGKRIYGNPTRKIGGQLEEEFAQDRSFS